MTVRRLTLLSAFGLLASVVTAVPADAAANLACGQTVTSSVMLSADIGPCAGDGLIVAADGISVDLGGHTVRGNGDPENDQVGIRVSSVAGATVKNGTVTAFAAGVALENTTGTTVKAIRAKGNTSSGDINHGDGIVMDGSSNNKVLGNDVSANGPFDGIGMVNGANGNLVKGNYVHDNTLVRTAPASAAPSQSNDGVRLDADSSSNTIDGNRIVSNGAGGVVAPGFPHADNVVANNLIKDNGGYGIVDPGHNYVLSGNTVIGNGFDQFQVPGRPKNLSDGILVFGNLGGGGGVVKDNRVVGNAEDGIALLTVGFSFFGTYHPPVIVQIEGNTVVNNARHGIFVACDFVADAFPRHVCITNPPPHAGEPVTENRASGNGGVNAGKSAWDLYDENLNCSVNQWHENIARTANPPCTVGK